MTRADNTTHHGKKTDGNNGDPNECLYCLLLHDTSP